MAAAKRVMKELAAMRTDPPEGCSAAPESDADVFSWNALLEGPRGTPYEGGRFRLRLQFPKDYPFKPVAVTFATPVFHPNVSRTGAVCLDVLKDKWSPALTASKVLLSLSSLLAEPNWSDPLEQEVVDAYRLDPREYERVARERTRAQAAA